MKKLREMKKNNKGFSLVELIVVIAIMVVLIAVLGSTILGYVEKSKYSKDISALDSIQTAVSTYVGDPDSDFPDNIATTPATLTALMANTSDVSNVISPILREVFAITDTATGHTGTFNASSEAFDEITTDDVLILIENGAVSICVPVNAAQADDYNAYTAGAHVWTNDQMSK